MTILEEIVANKKIEIKNLKAEIPFKKLEESVYFERLPLSLTEFLKDIKRTGIIAEFKKKSPSKGIINDKVSPEIITSGYANAGASGLSVLTEKKYFSGSDSDLIKAREANEIPILRKDFTIDEYQVIEAKSIGADVVLLIAACLDKKESLHLARLAHSLNLQVIMEIHELKEMGLVNEFIDIIGVNNRNLRTFEVTISTSLELAGSIPSDFLKISESGISNADAIKKLKDHGFDGFLIGENFMKETDPVKAFEEFVKQL